MGLGQLSRPLPLIRRVEKEEKHARLYKEELLELGAEITTREIYQQPEVWKETYRSNRESKEQEFLGDIGKRHGYIRILTGAGTSAYVGTPTPYLQEVHDERHWFPIHCDDRYRGASTNLSQKK